MPSVLIAGGGSGGHVAPAIATAEALTSQDATVLLVHSTRSIDRTLVEHSPFEGISVPATPLSANPFGLFRFCSGFIQTTRHIRALIHDRSIACVLATGGFVAAPALKAARSVGCPTVLLNLDDPPGKANRLAVRWADQVLSTVTCSLKNAVLINPPLRHCVMNSSKASECKERIGLDLHRMTLLITGASQGASTINQLVPALAKKYPTQFMGWQVLHIAGETHAAQVRAAWKEVDVPCVVLGFCHEMGDVWGAADLAITRGGANTIAEIAINAVPTIVLPYPYHRDEHQRTNSLHLEKIGGVVIATDHIGLEPNLAKVGNTILELLVDHKSRFSMRQCMAIATPSNGAIAIADTCLLCANASKR